MPDFNCACGHGFFLPVVQVTTISALQSQTGQKMLGQKLAFQCLSCKNTYTTEDIFEISERKPIFEVT